MASASDTVEDGSDKWATDITRVTVPIEIVVDIARPPPSTTVVSLLTNAAVHPTVDGLESEDGFQQPGTSSSRLPEPTARIDSEETRNQQESHRSLTSREVREAAIRSFVTKLLLAWYVVLFGALSFGVLVGAVLTNPDRPNHIQSTYSRTGEESVPGVSEIVVALPVVCSLSWNSTELLSNEASGTAWDGSWNICRTSKTASTDYDSCLFEDMRHFDVASGNVWVLSELPRGSRWDIVLTGDAARDVSGAVLDQRLLAAPQFKDLSDHSLLGESRRFAHWSPELLLTTGDAVLVSWEKTAGVCRNASEITLWAGAAVEDYSATGFEDADVMTLMISSQLDHQPTGSSYRLQYVDVESCSAVCKCDEPECRDDGPRSSGRAGTRARNNARRNDEDQQTSAATVCQCPACMLELDDPKQDHEFLSIQEALQADRAGQGKEEDSSRGPPDGEENDQLHHQDIIFGAEKQGYLAREALRLWLKPKIDRLRQKLSSYNSRRDGESVVGYTFAVPQA